MPGIIICRNRPVFFDSVRFLSVHKEIIVEDISTAKIAVSAVFSFQVRPGLEFSSQITTSSLHESTLSIGNSFRNELAFLFQTSRALVILLTHLQC